jgi:hypothetical protein
MEVEVEPDEAVVCSPLFLLPRGDVCERSSTTLSSSTPSPSLSLSLPLTLEPFAPLQLFQPIHSP